MVVNFLILAALQVICVLWYGWVVRTVITQPRIEHPPIFYRNPILGSILLSGHLVGWLALVICAFLFTDAPWLFLGLSVAGIVALSSKPGNTGAL